MIISTASKLFLRRVPVSRLLAPATAYGFSRHEKDVKNPWQSVVNEKNTNTTSYHVSKNLGLSRFLTRTYNTTGLAVGGALGVGYFASMIPAVVLNPIVPLLVGGITSLISFIAVNKMNHTIVQEPFQGVPIMRSENSALRLGVYALGIAALGLSGAPLFHMANMVDPTILPTSIALTCGLFGGASLAAYSMPKDKMIGYGRVLFGSLIGLIAMQLVGLGSLYFVGPNALSALLFSVQNYFGIALFTGFIAYDTHLSIKMYETGNPDHLGVSIQFLLDFWNLLINIVSMMTRRD